MYRWGCDSNMVKQQTNNLSIRYCLVFRLFHCSQLSRILIWILSLFRINSARHHKNLIRSIVLSICCFKSFICLRNIRSFSIFRCFIWMFGLFPPYCLHCCCYLWVGCSFLLRLLYGFRMLKSPSTCSIWLLQLLPIFGCVSAFSHYFWAAATQLLSGFSTGYVGEEHIS